MNDAMNGEPNPNAAPIAPTVMNPFLRNGGPAHPLVIHDSATKMEQFFPGMSMRDYCMVHAPATEIDAIAPDTVAGCASYLNMAETDYNSRQHYHLVLAKARALWADAMLGERL
jgi:hypothetical protein